jgi:hypothetical protein
MHTAQTKPLDETAPLLEGAVRPADLILGEVMEIVVLGLASTKTQDALSAILALSVPSSKALALEL